MEVGNFNVRQCLGLGNVWYECRVRSVVSYILTFNILLCRVYAFSLNRHNDDIYRFKCLWQTLAWPLKYWIREIHTNRKLISMCSVPVSSFNNLCKHSVSTSVSTKRLVGSGSKLFITSRFLKKEFEKCFKKASEHL